MNEETPMAGQAGEYSDAGQRRDFGASLRACCPRAKAGKIGGLALGKTLDLQGFSRCCARGRARSGDLGNRPSRRLLPISGRFADGRRRAGEGGFGGMPQADENTGSAAGHGWFRCGRQIDATQVGKPAIQQTGKSAVRGRRCGMVPQFWNSATCRLVQKRGHVGALQTLAGGRLFCNRAGIGQS